MNSLEMPINVLVERSYDQSYVLLTRVSHKTLNIDDLVNALEDNDMSVTNHVTGHLQLLDHRYDKTYMMNDYGVSCLDDLNNDIPFRCNLSILLITDFIN